jgi:flavin reductase (DIM6/NTAB) family NADH-FMN oxidoreductase RutF
VNTTSATLAHGQSEVDSAKLELIDIDGFALPRITDCDIAIACKLYSIDEIGRVPQAVIYGEIHSITINDALIVDHPKGRLQLDSLALDPLARLGGSNYGGLGDVLTANRPK